MRTAGGRAPSYGLCASGTSPAEAEMFHGTGAVFTGCRTAPALPVATTLLRHCDPVPVQSRLAVKTLHVPGDHRITTCSSAYRAAERDVAGANSMPYRRWENLLPSSVVIRGNCMLSLG